MLVATAAGVTVAVELLRPGLMNVACPLASVDSSAVKGTPTTTPELTPAGAVWICAPVSLVFAGKPVTLNWKSYVAPVMLLAASRVTVIVSCIVPLAVASAFVTGGTSFDGNRMAVNRATFGLSEGLVGESSQETANARTNASIAKRFIWSPPK